VNIILVSDSLAKSRSMTLSQGQVLLIAFGILMSGFFLAVATYYATLKFAVDAGNPYLRTLAPTCRRTTSSAPPPATVRASTPSP
jgi:hypothetical protein